MASQPAAYADTSFLVSLYRQDEFSAVAKSALRFGGLPLLLCELNRFEFENALRLLHFRKLITPRVMADAFTAFEQDEQAGLLRPVAMDWPAAFSMAQQVSARRTSKGGHRAMDLLHVAAALTHGVEHFYSFDKRQRVLAKQEGLVLNGISGPRRH